MDDLWSCPVCEVCGTLMGGDRDHTACFDRAKRAHLPESPVPTMDFRVTRIVVVGDDGVMLEEWAVFDGSVQDGGRTLKLFKVRDVKNGPR